ncbi:MAG: PD-(D/E)XK nuclease domain-containing protein [Tannerella sp.]|nr:PD-(D/E)XK nuclease domain-containing protein [Tannerella sp.]
MSELVTQNILQSKDESYSQCRRDLLNGLLTKAKEPVIGAFNRLLASVPYDDYTNAAKHKVVIDGHRFPAQEWLYRATIFGFLRGCGVVVVAEMHTNLGRADLVVAHRGVLWVIELKVAYTSENAEAKAEEAYRQIMDNDYATPYPGAVCLGLCIDNSTRQITASQANFSPCIDDAM